MAKANIIGISGGILSLVCVVVLLFIAIATLGFSSGPTANEREDLRAVVTLLAVVYTAGAVIGLLSQLGAFMQLPSLLISLPIIWYIGYNPIFYILYFIGLIGPSLLILAMFVEYSRADKAFKAPPFSRMRTWALGEAESGARPLPKRAIVAIIAVLCACLIATAAFAAYAWRNDVSELHIEFYTDGSRYGSVNISVQVDGEEVYTTYVPYDPMGHWLIFAETSCKVPAGTHLVEVDVWNGLALEEGDVDTMMKARTLPFMTQYEMLSLGVGFI